LISAVRVVALFVLLGRLSYALTDADRCTLTRECNCIIPLGCESFFDPDWATVCKVFQCPGDTSTCYKNKNDRTASVTADNCYPTDSGPQQPTATSESGTVSSTTTTDATETSVYTTIITTTVGGSVKTTVTTVTKTSKKTASNTPSSKADTTDNSSCATCAWFSKNVFIIVGVMLVLIIILCVTIYRIRNGGRSYGRRWR